VVVFGGYVLGSVVWCEVEVSGVVPKPFDLECLGALPQRHASLFLRDVVGQWG